MMRAFFLALGITSLILGLECMVIERAELAGDRTATAASLTRRATSSYREVEPPEWAPWSLMSAGAVVILYTFTLPKKMQGG